jgi:hypothetical protein
MKKFVRLHKGIALATTVGLGYLMMGLPAFAGADDDTQRANIAPVLGTPPLSDNPTNASQTVGLRIFPPTDTQLIEHQRFDLRIETQVPSTKRLSSKVRDSKVGIQRCPISMELPPATETSRKKASIPSKP